MNNLNNNQKEQRGEKLWEHYLTNLLVQFKNINRPHFVSNFWAQYEQLIRQDSLDHPLTPHQPTAKPPHTENDVAYQLIFQKYWPSPLRLGHYTTQRLKRKLTKTLVYVLLSVLMIPLALIYLKQTLGRLVVVVSIVLISFPREKSTAQDKEVKVAEFEFKHHELSYHAPNKPEVAIPYASIGNLWHDAQGRLLVGTNAQEQWPDTKGLANHRVIIPNTNTDHWQQVREFLSEVVKYNLQQNTS